MCKTTRSCSGRRNRRKFDLDSLVLLLFCFESIVCTNLERPLNIDVEDETTTTQNSVVNGNDAPKRFYSLWSVCSMFWVSCAWRFHNLLLPANLKIRVFREVGEQVVLATNVLATWLVWRWLF